MYNFNLLSDTLVCIVVTVSRASELRYMFYYYCTEKCLLTPFLKHPPIQFQELPKS